MAERFLKQNYGHACQTRFSVLLREFTINGRCAVKGSARGDGKKERGETPFHRPPSHHPSRSLRSRSLEFRFPTCDPNKIRVNSENGVSRKHSL